MLILSNIYDIYNIQNILILFVILIVYITSYSLFNKYINFNNFFYFYINIFYMLFILIINTKIINYININFNISKSIFNSNYFLQIFELNMLSLHYCTVTLSITFFVNVYLYLYKKLDNLKINFFLLINFFFISMVFFFISSNIITMFLFWELIGIISYFLINFFFNKTITFKSSLKALSFNKYSDFNFIGTIVVFYSLTNTTVVNNLTINNLLINNIYLNFFFFKINSTTLFLFFLCNCAFVKSAQILYHFWLPDSMEAPLPASALIHSATLIAAGIYLLNKFSIIFYFNTFTLYLVIIYFTLTFYFGSLVSAYQTDIKKILAYSTISNCGLMFFSIFMSSKSSSMLYFSYHGFFKSMSFLIAGQLVLQFNHSQDIRLFSTNSNVSIFMNFYMFLSMWSLASAYFIFDSFIKHYAFSNNYCSLLVRFFFTNSIIYSIIYSFKIYFFFKKSNKKKIIKISKKTFEIIIITCFTTFIYYYMHNMPNYDIYTIDIKILDKYLNALVIITTYLFYKSR